MRGRRGRRWVAPVGVTAATALAVAGLLAATDGRVAPVGGAAAAFLPPDGAVSWQTTPDGAVAQWEQARTAAAPALFLLPDGLAGQVFDGYPVDDQTATAWTSLGDAAAARDGGIARDLHTVTGDGIRLVASVGGASDIGFSPGLLALPADVADGVTWSSRGTAFFATLDDTGAPSSGRFDYTADLAAHAPSDPRLAPAVQPGCLEVDAHVTFTTGGGDAISSDGTDLWCPAAGIVASTSDTGATLPAAEPAGGAVSIDPPPTAWGDSAAWSADALDTGWDDALWGDPAFAPTPSLPPAVLADGRLAVDDTSNDVVVLRRSGDRLVVDRMLHPGGRVLGIGAAGDLLVVSTSDRRLVAYDAAGERRWSRTLPDLVAAPVVGTADGVVVAGLDGVVRLLDPATGADRWATQVSASGVEQLAVAGGVVVAADQSGGLAGVGLADGAARWQAGADEVYVALRVDADAVVAATGDLLQSIDPATGSTSWQTDVAASVTGVAVAGDAVVATTLSGSLAVGLADGVVRWRGPRDAARVVSDGRTAVVEGGGAVTVLGPDGSAAATFAVPAESLGSARSLTAGPSAVWLVDSVAGIVEVGR